MEKPVREWSLSELAASVDGVVRGPGDLVIRQAVPAGMDAADGITFAEKPRFLEAVLASGVGAVIVAKGSPEFDKPAILVDNPRLAFGMVLAQMRREPPVAPGIHPTAVVDPLAEVDPAASIGAYAVIERYAKVASGARVYPFCYVGEACEVGEGAVLYPHAVLVQDVTVGPRAIVYSGAVLGADGFGFEWDGRRQIKVPQVGGVRLGADAEIGANTCVDRAMCAETVVEDDVKLDNLIHVGHNCSIGRHTVAAALVGISGSTKVGERVTIAGQAGFSDHVTVCDDVVIGGQAGVLGSIDKPGAYSGMPQMPHGEWLRARAVYGKLPALLERLKQLEREVEELRSK